EWFAPAVGDGLEDGHRGGGGGGAGQFGDGLVDALGSKVAVFCAASGDAIGDEDEPVAGGEAAVGWGELSLGGSSPERLVVGALEFFEVSVGIGEVGVGVAAVDPGVGASGGSPAGDGGGHVEVGVLVASYR